MERRFQLFMLRKVVRSKYIELSLPAPLMGGHLPIACDGPIPVFCFACICEQELAFEEWKVRELSRVRQEKEERESAIKVGDSSLTCLQYLHPQSGFEIFV